MAEFDKEIEGMSEQEITARLRRDGEFVGRALGNMAQKHPEMFEVTGPTYSTEEVAAQLGIELTPRDQE